MACLTVIPIWQSGLALLPLRSRSRRRATSIISGPRISSASTPIRPAGSCGKSRPVRDSALDVMAGHEAGDDRPRDLVQGREEFVDLCRRSVGDKDDVLVAHREFADQ